MWRHWSKGRLVDYYRVRRLRLLQRLLLSSHHLQPPPGLPLALALRLTSDVTPLYPPPGPHRPHLSPLLSPSPLLPPSLLPITQTPYKETLSTLKIWITPVTLSSQDGGPAPAPLPLPRVTRETRLFPRPLPVKLRQTRTLSSLTRPAPPPPPSPSGRPSHPQPPPPPRRRDCPLIAVALAREGHSISTDLIWREKSLIADHELMYIKYPNLPPTAN